MLLTLDRDEVPHIIANEYESPEQSSHHDMIVEVTDVWWEAYREARDYFYTFQDRLAKMYGGYDDEWFPADEGPDCD